MKKLILMLVLILTFTSCKAQEGIALPTGHTIGYVVELTEKGAMVNAGGKSMIVNDTKDILESGVEYDLVYTILSRRDKTLVVDLISAEHSAKENARRRAKLLSLLNK